MKEPHRQPVADQERGCDDRLRAQARIECDQRRDAPRDPKSLQHAHDPLVLYPLKLEDAIVDQPKADQRERPRQRRLQGMSLVPAVRSCSFLSLDLSYSIDVPIPRALRPSPLFKKTGNRPQLFITW